MKKILFYSDNSDFGGHEVENVDAARYLCQQPDLDVGFIFYEGNRRLYQRLSAIKENGGRILLYPISYCAKRLQAFRTMVSINKIKAMERLFRRIHPDLVIIAAGHIEHCTLGLLAAKKAGYRSINYIPTAHKVSVMGKKYGSTIREALNYYYYRVADHYITGCNAMRRELILRGVTTKISVVYTGIDLTKYSLLERDVCRSEFALGDSQYLIGCVGRILFRHKAQDFLIETLAKNRHKLKDVKLVIVGDGPDLVRLKDMVTFAQLVDTVSFVGWNDDLSKIFSALDMLIIPSWFEGLPLVMLIAMYYGIPIVASNVDGMVEILPPSWLFKTGDSDSLVETLLAVKNGDNSEVIQKNKMLIEQEYNLKKFGTNFLKAINEWL
jgi:glycosyltransferase involved in cell wall biosynthesis